MTFDTPSAAAALAARPLAAHALPSRLQIGTDTRSVVPGLTFLALRGDRFDGHAFVADAFARGAAACIVDDPASVPAGRPALLVADTLQAYLALGALARGSIRGPVIAISGSAGKTTTKAYLAALLAAAGVPVAATPENENNEIGVSKFLTGLDDADPRIAIVEMGARKPRDIERLVAAARPDISVLTNVGDAHLEIMGSPERLADTKWGLFGSGARAVLSLADRVSRERAGTLAAAPVWFGIDGEEPPPGGRAVVIADGHTLVVHEPAGRREFAIDARVPGAHNRRNLAAALAAAVAAGQAPDLLAPFIGMLRQPSKRYETIMLDGGIRLIFDAYNASMSGTLATLDAFAAEAASRRIAVLGSMAELGADAAAMHQRVGTAAAGASDIILAGGEFADDIVRGAVEAGAASSRIVTYAGNAAAVGWLRANARSGDAVLLKGSRKYKMEEIADALRAEDGR